MKRFNSTEEESRKLLNATETSSKSGPDHKRTQAALLLVALLGLACLVAVVSPHVGGRATVDLPSFLETSEDNTCSITFYKDRDFRGDSQTLSGTNSCLKRLISDCSPSVPNDAVSSIKTTCQSITLYKDSNAKGQSRTLECGNYGFLPNFGFPNDQLSSVVVHNNGASCPPTPVCVITLFVDRSFKGNSFSVAGNDECVNGIVSSCHPSIPNDKISSIQTNCKSITLYEHSNRRGHSQVLTCGNYGFLPDFGFGNDQLSSIFVNDDGVC